MERATKIWPFLYVVIITAMGVQPTLAAETCNRVVAIVNDDVVTLHELNKKMRELTGLAPEDLQFQDEERYLKTRREVLEHIIDDRIAQEKIRELGIQVNEEQVDSAIERVKSDNKLTQEDLVAGLKREGMSYEKYRQKIKRDLEVHKLINFEVKSKIIVRDEDIVAYYEENKDKFSSAGQVRLAGIFLLREDPEDEEELDELTKKGEAILTRLKQGESFGDLARSFSQGPGVEEGGDLGTFTLADLDPALVKIVKDTPAGGISGLIIASNGIQILKVVEKQGGESKSLADVRDTIYGELYREEMDKVYAAWLKELRESSYTKTIF
jgi:peptidyl-prolyl cis-trans isomerase SurA